MYRDVGAYRSVGSAKPEGRTEYCVCSGKWKMEDRVYQRVSYQSVEVRLPKCREHQSVVQKLSTDSGKQDCSQWIWLSQLLQYGDCKALAC